MSNFRRGMNRHVFYQRAKFLGVLCYIPNRTGHTRVEHPKMKKSVVFHKEITTEVVNWIRKIERNEFDNGNGFGPMKA